MQLLTDLCNPSSDIRHPHLLPVEVEIHLVNSDKCIAPIASAGRVADCVVARREAGEHTWENYHGNREINEEKENIVIGQDCQVNAKSRVADCVVASETVL